MLEVSFRYVFTGAEVYPDSSDDEDDNDNEDEDNNPDGPSDPPADSSEQIEEAIQTPKLLPHVSKDLE